MPKLSLADDIVEEKSKYSWKILIFGILGSFWALAIGFLIAQVFQGGDIIGLHSAWWLLLFTIIFTINFILEGVFANSNRLIFLVIQSATLALGFYLAGDLSKYWHIGLGIIPFAFLFFGRQAIRRAEQDMIKIRWHRMVGRGTNLLITGLIIFMVVGLGFSLVNRPAKDFLFSKDSLARFLDGSNFIGKILYKDFNWQMSFNDFAQGVVEKTTGSIIDGETLSELPLSLSGAVEVQRQESIKQGAIAFKKQAEQFLKIDIGDEQSLLDVAYTWLNTKFQSLSDTTKKGLIIGLIFLIFLILKAVAPILSWLSRALSWLIYELLVAVGFASLAYETRNKEAIILE